MIKKNHKYLVGLLCICFLWCSSVCIPVYASEVIQHTLLYSSTLLKRTDGVVSLVSQSNRSTYYVDLTSYSSGTITVTSDTNAYGAVVVSTQDTPNDIEIGYTFISNDFHSINNVNSITVDIPDNCYVYISYNKSFSVIYTPNTPVDPTPTFTPTPTPIISSDGIPLHYDIPFDYYMIAIIILLGGILICQFFKN